MERPDPTIDALWAEDSNKRWDAYRRGELETMPYNEVMERYRNR
ncbi:addiction module protein [Endothiovibrio diazotrophicus]